MFYFIIVYLFLLSYSFFENPNLIHETRQKGLFDSNTKYFKELAFGLRSVRKELMINTQSVHSQQLVEYVSFFIIFISIFYNN